MAASLCFYVFFSIFPLLLVLVAVAGQFLSADEAMRHAIRLIAELFPAQQTALVDVLKGVMEHRGQASLIGFVVLLWSAKNVFMGLSHAMNFVWGVSDRHWVVENLRAIGVAFSCGLLIVLVSLGFATAHAMMAFQVPKLGWHPAMIPGFVPSLVALFPPVFAFLIVAALYRWLPNRHLKWRDVWQGALVATLVWDVVRRAFGYYLEHFARYDLVYGSLGSVVGFLFWIYVSGLIFLLGVEITKERVERQAFNPINTENL